MKKQGSHAGWGLAPLQGDTAPDNGLADAAGVKRHDGGRFPGLAQVFRSENNSCRTRKIVYSPVYRLVR